MWCYAVSLSRERKGFQSSLSTYSSWRRINCFFSQSASTGIGTIVWGCFCLPVVWYCASLSPHGKVHFLWKQVWLTDCLDRCHPDGFSPTNTWWAPPFFSWSLIRVSCIFPFSCAVLLKAVGRDESSGKLGARLAGSVTSWMSCYSTWIFYTILYKSFDCFLHNFKYLLLQIMLNNMTTIKVCK